MEREGKNDASHPPLWHRGWIWKFGDKSLSAGFHGVQCPTNQRVSCMATMKTNRQQPSVSTISV